jgi:hypothetical protein
MEERYVARHSQRYPLVKSVIAMRRPRRIEPFCYYSSMVSTVYRRATHEHTTDSTYYERYSPMMLRYPRYTILSAKLLVVLFI